MTNIEIVSSFLQHQPAAGPVSTNGKEIVASGVTIAKWKEDGIIMPDTSKSPDKGATRCRNLVRHLAISKGIKVTETS
jgi:hypothetical protein